MKKSKQACYLRLIDYLKRSYDIAKESGRKKDAEEIRSMVLTGRGFDMDDEFQIYKNGAFEQVHYSINAHTTAELVYFMEVNIADDTGIYRTRFTNDEWNVILRYMRKAFKHIDDGFIDGE